jgi:hypothetical protein
MVEGMGRVAIGDLFIDVEVSPHLTVAYSPSGALVLEDADDPIYLIEASAFRVEPKDPSQQAVCVEFNRHRAHEAGKPLVEISPEHVYWQEADSYSGSDGQPVSCLHWHVGLGNRSATITLSYRESDADQIDRGALATIVDAMARSVRPTHEELAPVQGAAVVRDLAPSQAPWLESQRVRLAERLGGTPTLPALDALWQQMVGGEPEEGEVNAIINEIGVAFGDELARSRHRFEWAVVTDAFGTALSVVARRDTAKIAIEPFNFVAKRWESREPRFLVHGVAAILEQVDQIAW